MNTIPYKFTAKELDEETGLYYYGARYLNPRTSRWISSDPAGFDLINPMDYEGKPRPGFSIVEANNWYSYVSNNPIKYVDPTGAQQIAGQDRALYKVPKGVVKGWVSDWTSTMNEIGNLRIDIGGLQSELLVLNDKKKGLINEAIIKLAPGAVAGIMEAYSTGSTQTLAETSSDALYYAEELIGIKKREDSIPGEIDILKSEIKAKEQTAGNLMNIIEGQAKLDLWLKQEDDK